MVVCGNDPISVGKWSSNGCVVIFPGLEVIIIGYRNAKKIMLFLIMLKFFLLLRLKCPKFTARRRKNLLVYLKPLSNFGYSWLAVFIEEIATQPLDHFHGMIGSPHNPWIISPQWLDYHTTIRSQLQCLDPHTTIGSFPHNDKICDPSLYNVVEDYWSCSTMKSIKTGIYNFLVGRDGA